MRQFQMIGQINEEMLERVSEALEDAYKDNKELHILLSSEGGSTYDALAIASLIRSSDRKVGITAVGLVASAAVIILASGHRRLMTEESWVMVHEESDKLKGDVVSLERESAHMRRMENQWAVLLQKKTKLHADEWTRLHKNTTYMNAEECLKAGLIDEII